MAYINNVIPYYEYNSWQAGDHSGYGIPPEAFTTYGQPVPYGNNPPAGPGTPVVSQPNPNANLTTEQKSAKAALSDTLGIYGLQSLGDWAWQRYLDGYPVEQIMLDMRQTTEYKTRFAGMEALQKKGRAISEAEYINLERTYAQIYSAAGMPKSFYDDPTDFAKLIGGEVSPKEIEDRVAMATQATYQADPTTKAELERLYGIGRGDLVAYWLDPDKALPLLQQRFHSGELAGASSRSGYGQLTQAEAERLAAAGISNDQAQQGFGNLAQSRELFQALPGEAQFQVNRDEQLGAAFLGDSGAAERIKRKAAQRKAEFDAGGGYATTNKGVSGLSSA